jgi:hypothetical protein
MPLTGSSRIPVTVTGDGTVQQALLPAIILFLPAPIGVPAHLRVGNGVVNTRVVQQGGQQLWSEYRLPTALETGAKTRRPEPPVIDDKVAFIRD